MKEFLSRRQEELFTTISNGRQVASISVMAFLYVWTLSNISLMVGLAGQIKQSIPAGVTTLAAIEFGTLPVDAQNQISNAVCEYRDTDISGILALSFLLSPEFSASVNSCAAYALRPIHSREALPTLRKPLDGNSAVTRYDAVIGIAQFAMGFPIVGSADKPAVMGRFSREIEISEMRQTIQR